MPEITSVLTTDRPVLSVITTVTPQEIDAVVTDRLALLRDVARNRGLTVTGDPFGVFHGPVTDDSHGPLEIALPVDGLADAGEGVRSHRLTGGLMARCCVEGEQACFPAVLTVYDDLHRWVVAAGGVPVGPPRETWHTAPGDPGSARLTVAWPYAPVPDARPGA